MNWIEKISRYYATGTWNKTRVRNAVKKGKITAEEYRQITGEAYEQPAND